MSYFFCKLTRCHMQGALCTEFKYKNGFQATKKARDYTGFSLLTCLSTGLAVIFT